MLIGLYRMLLRLPQFKGVSTLREGYRRLFFRPHVARTANGLRFEIDPWEWTQIEILRQDILEPRTLELYRSLLREGNIYVDVGAHVGFHLLFASRLVGAGGCLVAIEPQPYNCDKILANCRLNEVSNAIVVVAAAGNRDGAVILHSQTMRDKARLSLRLEPVNDEAQRFAVPMLRLDGVLNRIGVEKVHLLKVDVEGFEFEVLRGLSREALAQVENVIVEVLPVSQDAAETAELVSLLLGAGFRLCDVEGNAWSPGAPLVESNLWASRAE